MPTYLITGATRGIGRGLVAALLQRPSNLVIAGVRDPTASTAQSLSSLPKAEGSRVQIVKIDSTSDTDAQTAIAGLGEEIQFDVVIANAGAPQSALKPVAELDVDEVRRLFETNTLGPLKLFQAVVPKLREGGKFLVISSLGGSMTMAIGMPFGAGGYGCSKAGINYFMRKAAGENPSFTIFSAHPGLVETELARDVIASSGMAAISVDESVAGLLALLDKPHAEVRGKFLDWKGDALPF